MGGFTTEYHSKLDGWLKNRGFLSIGAKQKDWIKLWPTIISITELSREQLS